MCKRDSNASSLWAIAIFAFSLLVCSTTVGQQTQPQVPVGSDWRFSVNQDQVAQTDITAKNICHKRHRFKVELQNLPFMTLVGSASFQVHAGADHKLPVKVDATGLKPGDYEGLAVVICETCGKEKGCTQDRQNLHVRMSVLPSEKIAGNPPTPGTTPQPTPVVGQPSVPGPTLVSNLPRPQDKQKCDCTITAKFPGKGGKDNKDKKRKVTVEKGKASVEFGISGTVKTSKAKETVHPIVHVKYYFTYHHKVPGADQWEKASEPQEETVDIGELPCDGNTTPFERWFSVPVPAGPAGQANVAYELHLYAYSTKECPMTPVRGYLKFVVSYAAGNANDRPKNDKDAEDEFPYDRDGRGMKSDSSGFGFDGTGNMVLPKPKK